MVFKKAKSSVLAMDPVCLEFIKSLGEKYYGSKNPGISFQNAPSISYEDFMRVMKSYL